MSNDSEQMKMYAQAVPRHNSLEDHARRLQDENCEDRNSRYAELKAITSQPHDPINRPSHYTSGGIETIDFIEAKGLNYNLGNVVKYISRHDKKGNRLENLEKAFWYLQREIETLKGM